MAGQRPPPGGDRPSLQSVRRGRRSSWRVTALVIGALALALAYVGRFGLPDLAGPAASASPSASPTAAAPASPSSPPSPTVPADSFAPTPVTGPSLPGRPTASAPPAAPADRYRDGIPARIGAEPVLTVDEVVRMSRADVDGLLVGGWYREGLLRGRIGGSDSARRILVRGLDVPAGPLVARITAGRFTQTDSVFDATEIVWTGDLQSDSAPISVMPLLDALVNGYYANDQLGFDPVSLGLAEIALDCSMAWPRHTYQADHGPVRLALVFSSPIERLFAEVAITQSQYPSAPDAGHPDCPHPVVRATGRTRWIVDGNVMLLIRGGEGNTRIARQALADARAESQQPEQPWRPLTGWQALRGLWTAYPDLDVAPPAEEVFCVLGLPADSWSIRHPQLRGMAIFDSTVEREEFQATTLATDVRLERGACSSLGGQRPIDADARWLGKDNVLLLVTGDGSIDAALLDALPSGPLRTWWP